MKAVLGFIMVWLLEGIVLQLPHLSFSGIDRQSPSIWCLGGICAGLLVFFKVRLLPVYVFGHEFTHWIIGKIFLRKTSRFTVHSRSGSVRVERPNIWIVLGPYIFPVYMLALMCLYGVVVICVPRLPIQVMYGVAVVLGLLYAYHVVLTYVALRLKQPDLEINGKVFSLVFIFFFNVLFLFIVLAGLSDNPADQFLGVPRTIYEQGRWIALQVRKLCSGA